MSQNIAYEIWKSLEAHHEGDKERDERENNFFLKRLLIDIALKKAWKSKLAKMNDMSLLPS